jgi:protoporphyrinogen/coproporphyrinogen III oxidase
LAGNSIVGNRIAMSNRIRSPGSLSFARLTAERNERIGGSTKAARYNPLMPNVIIVGAGISGLSLTYRLHQLAPAVSFAVLDSADRVGGCVRTDRRDGFTVECGPNGFLDSKPATIGLARDVGLADRLIPASDAAARNRFLFQGRGLQPLPGSLPALLCSPLLSMRGKLELLGEPFHGWRRKKGPESVAEFARRRAGREAADIFADALVTGIHAGDPNRLDVRAAFPRLTALEREHGSVVIGMMRQKSPRGRLWSFRNGMQTLTDELRERMPNPPILGVRIRRIERGENGWAVIGDGQDRWQADSVVLTCPAYAQAEMLADLDPQLAELIGGIAYNRIAVVALGYRAADVPVADGFGYIAPQRLRRDLLGVQWCSATYPDRAPPGMVLWRALCGGWNRPEIVGWSDEKLVAAVRCELRLAQGVTAEPVFDHIVRWENAIPQYVLGHPERVAAIEARLAEYHPDLFLAGNAYRGVALNDCTEQAELLAQRILQKPPPVPGSA